MFPLKENRIRLGGWWSADRGIWKTFSRLLPAAGVFVAA